MKFIIYTNKDFYNNKHIGKEKEYESKDLDSLLSQLKKEKVDLEKIKIADKKTGYIIY